MEDGPLASLSLPFWRLMNLLKKIHGGVSRSVKGLESLPLLPSVLAACSSDLFSLLPPCGGIVWFPVSLHLSRVRRALLIVSFGLMVSDKVAKFRLIRSLSLVLAGGMDF